MISTAVMAEFATWPSVRDVALRLDYSVMHISRLVRSGKLQAVRTRVGWLIDPESVAAYDAERETREARKAAQA